MFRARRLPDPLIRVPGLAQSAQLCFAYMEKLVMILFFSLLILLPGVGHPLDYQNGCLIIFLFFSLFSLHFFVRVSFQIY